MLVIAQELGKPQRIRPIRPESWRQDIFWFPPPEIHAAINRKIRRRAAELTIRDYYRMKEVESSG